MHKPKEMDMRTFMGRLTEINNKLVEFLPFAGEGQKLAEEEIVDIGEFGTPNAWQREMIVQNFDALAGTPQDLVDFCKRMERTEKDLDAPIPKKAKAKPTNKGNQGKTPDKWCEFCEMNNHNTNQCFKLKAHK